VFRRRASFINDPRHVAAYRAAVDAVVTQARKALVAGEGTSGEEAFSPFVSALMARRMRPFLLSPRATADVVALWRYWEKARGESYAAETMELLVENTPSLLPDFRADPCVAPVSQDVYLYFVLRDRGAWFYHFVHPGTETLWTQ